MGRISGILCSRGLISGSSKFCNEAAARFGCAGGAGLSAASCAVAHGVVGGVSSELMGGKFGAGFLSAGFAKLAAPYVNNISTVQARVVASAVIGGTASEIAGGKFANGAMSAAFGRLYNEESPKSFLETVEETFDSAYFELGPPAGGGAITLKGGEFFELSFEAYFSYGAGIDADGPYLTSSSRVRAALSATQYGGGVTLLSHEIRDWGNKLEISKQGFTVTSPRLDTWVELKVVGTPGWFKAGFDTQPLKNYFDDLP